MLSQRTESEKKQAQDVTRAGKECLRSFVIMQTTSVNFNGKTPHPYTDTSCQLSHESMFEPLHQLTIEAMGVLCEKKGNTERLERFSVKVQHHFSINVHIFEVTGTDKERKIAMSPKKSSR